MTNEAQQGEYWKEDWHSGIFEPKDFIKITSNGGNIGRLHWYNQSYFVIESWDADRDPYVPGASFWWINAPSKVDIGTLPGCCAFIWNLGDWWAWLAG